ncbi:DCC1-like thiol-disulfide oxidoreductase family protein [Cohnella sp. REN36]|uniref:thiol-disulfide oxidoreductase DCC family protein n=1 Tax=Cohnella sp. REN36 TaxID=2887347 RepID=UPI001D143455|nr:DCC1-like thiol-disulfide oxidoreductase family protein [Cohnella sp. REN36]
MGRQQRRQIPRRASILLLIDGDCPLCRTLTRFVARRDSADRFRFAALDSEYGRLALKSAGLAKNHGEGNGTFVLIQHGRPFVKSEAALRVFRHLGGGWPLLYAGILVPVQLRDRAYDWIAARRYRWSAFRRAEACPLPDEETRRRLNDKVSGQEEEGR